jgi:hypothetical protein
MRYLKTFENFDLGPRFTDDSVETDEQDWLTRAKEIENEEPESFEDEDEDEDDCEECGDDEMEETEGRMPRVWGDEVVEKKKMNAGFQAYLDKQKAKKGGKDEEKGGKKSKPDFLDLDKDGNKKESMKKAAKDAKDAKDDKKDDKGGKKGLTAGQKRLPEAMQKAILKKQK